MTNKKIFPTRIDREILKELKYPGVNTEKPISRLFEEAVKDLLKKYQGKGQK
jgi:flagellar biosynthesis/type III secretory pathway ATPase